MTDKPKQEKPKTPEEFVEAYNKLCKEYGFNIVTNPAFKARDDGTWSIVLQNAIGKLPDEK